MKIFAIRDDDLENKDLAYLLYYEQSRCFYIEMPENADPWEMPLLLSSFLKRGECTVNAYWSKLWVQQRIVPPDRQNLGLILKENKLTQYDEYRLLLLGKGRCAQDSCYLVPLAEADQPPLLTKRHSYKVKEVVPLANFKLLVFFCDGKVNKCDAVTFIGNEPSFQPVLQHEEIFSSVNVLPGGYGIGWGDQLTIADKELYEHGHEIDINLNAFHSFVRHRLVSAAQAEDILQCSRQNLNTLVRKGALHPIKSEGRVTLFLKNEIMKRGAEHE